MVNQPLDDPERLEAIRRSGLLNADRDHELDRLSQMAARIMGTPVALVTLVDDRQQFIKSVGGSGEKSDWQGMSQTLDRSYCQFSIMGRKPLLIEDAREHDLVARSPAIADGVIAYAGVPLTSPEGEAIGALCVVDSKPRSWNDDDVENLVALARSASKLLDQRAAGPDAGANEPIQLGATLLDCVRNHFEALGAYNAVIANGAQALDVSAEADARRAVIDSVDALQLMFSNLAAKEREGALGEAVGTYLHTRARREELAAAFRRGETTLGTLEGAIADHQDAGDLLRRVLIRIEDSE